MRSSPSCSNAVWSTADELYVCEDMQNCWLQETSEVPFLNVMDKSHGQISETGTEGWVEDRVY